MSIDRLQEKIRKTKNPSMIELCPDPAQVPQEILDAAQSRAAACGQYAMELLSALKGIVPAVKVSFSGFALLGSEGMTQLQQVLTTAKDLGYYVLLESPMLLSAQMAGLTAQAAWGADGRYPCDGILIGGYAGSDVIKPFLPYAEKADKDIFVAVRTANKSAPELQDLLSGSRLVHAVAADHVNRYGSNAMGRRGYSRVGVMAAASSAESLKNLRARYPKLFLLIDGADYPNANARNCSFAFDKLGYGAAAVIGNSVTCAWMETEGDWREAARNAAERMKRNFNRYVNIL